MNVIVKAADESVTSSAAVQDDNHLIIPIAANESIQFDAVLFPQSGGGGFRYTFTGPAGAVGRFAPGSSSGELAVEATTTNNDRIVVTGGIQNGGTAGNLTLRWAQSTSFGSATTLHAGSYIKWQKQE